MFSPLGYGGGYHDLLSDMYGDSDDDYDDTPVDFLRPDGDIEGKDVQWCLDNNFFQVPQIIHYGLEIGIIRIIQKRSICTNNV